MNYRCFFVLSLILALLLQPALFAKAEVSPILENHILHLEASDNFSAWVFFTDKGSDWQSRLSEAAENFHPRALERRLKNRSTENLLDFYDVPVKRAYIQAVSQLQISIRQKSRWLNAVSVEMNKGQLAELKNFPFIKNIEPLAKYKAPEMPEPGGANPAAPIESTNHNFDYGASFTQVSQINVPVLHDMGYSGSGVLVCILDGGFDNLPHEALTPLNILQTWDFVNGDSSVANDPGQMGEGSHGTATLGTMAGFKPGELVGPAYGASFILGKTENTDYERHIEEDNWVAGAEWADSLGADIISSSLGYRDGFTNGEPDYTWQDMDGKTTIVARGAQIAAQKGLLIVNSAGNEGSSSAGNPNTLVSPSDCDSVVCVGAVASDGSRVSFSSMGPTSDGRIKPDVMAMGSGVITASSTSLNGYKSVSGTSFSCPLTAGVAALILEVNPGLSNVQILDALRQTADNNSNPNNEYGWGIVDAYAAAFYFTPQISHTPLSDTEDLSGPYSVDVNIQSVFSLTADSLDVYYRVNQGPFQNVDLTPQGGNAYAANIPGPASAGTVEYYIYARTDVGGVATHPTQAPQNLHAFYVGPDTVKPVILHTPLANVAHVSWPARIKAIISDNLGIDANSVLVEWQKNSVPQTSFSLVHAGANDFVGYFNQDSSAVQVGDVIEYKISAADLAGTPNSTVLPAQGYLQFTVLQTRGLVLVIDDESGSDRAADSRAGGESYFYNKSRAASHSFENHLLDLNFLVTRETVSATDPASWNQYQLVISASGENTQPLANANYRAALVQYVQSGGKLLIEGGEVGYDAASSPGYPDIASQVIHSDDWNGDNEGPINKMAAQAGHPICSQPNPLPQSMSLNYNSGSTWYDQDAMLPVGGAYLVYDTQGEPNNAGILVYDDNTNPVSAQIVYYAFDYSSLIDTVAAKNLLENTVMYLLADEQITDLNKGNELVPSTIELYANYPNPFNPETTIRFSLPVKQKVELAVYNSLGQKVAVLINKEMNAGENKTIWNAANVASGVYYVVLKADQATKIQKAVLLK